MKRIVFLLLFSTLHCLAFSQTENKTSQNTSVRFQEFYNSAKYDSIFFMFSKKMQTDFPQKKNNDFLTQLQSGYGSIKKMSFEAYDESYARYKTDFEKGILTVRISTDPDSLINGLFFKPVEAVDNYPVPKRNSTIMDLPFRGEWTVFWGGDTKELNYHVAVKFQRNAFDIIITDKDGKSHKTDGKTNEDYYAFGQELIAPCDGEIVSAIDGVKDNVPGALNSIYIAGNSILLKTANNEYLLFAHFKNHTIKVKEGDKIKRGQLLGLCGNSGNSSEPHLHFHIQNIEDINKAAGVKCYFDKIVVNGEIKNDYSPIKGDRVQAAGRK